MGVLKDGLNIDKSLPIKTLAQPSNKRPFSCSKPNQTPSSLLQLRLQRNISPINIHQRIDTPSNIRPRNPPHKNIMSPIRKPPINLTKKSRLRIPQIRRSSTIASPITLFKTPLALDCPAAASAGDSLVRRVQDVEAEGRAFDQGGVHRCGLVDAD